VHKLKLQFDKSKFNFQFENKNKIRKTNKKANTEKKKKITKNQAINIKYQASKTSATTSKNDQKRVNNIRVRRQKTSKKESISVENC
jgi:hypothetical protein